MCRCIVRRDVCLGDIHKSATECRKHECGNFNIMRGLRHWIWRGIVIGHGPAWSIWRFVTGCLSIPACWSEFLRFVVALNGVRSKVKINPSWLLLVAPEIFVKLSLEQCVMPAYAARDYNATCMKRSQPFGRPQYFATRGTTVWAQTNEWTKNRPTCGCCSSGIHF